VPYTRMFPSSKSSTCPTTALILPILPVENWQGTYARFLETLLECVPLQSITLVQICICSGALRLMERKLGRRNSISSRLDGPKSPDGRTRFPFELRVQVCRHLIDRIRQILPALDIGLCLEYRCTFEALDMQTAIGRCNCVL
jgi:hypothetical protein